MKNSTVVAGGGAIDVCLHSKYDVNLIGL
jgi:hypothetical protein